VQQLTKGATPVGNVNTERAALSLRKGNIVEVDFAGAAIAFTGDGWV
jgi:hypothetical protein